jgi:hypothetical protein
MTSLLDPLTDAAREVLDELLDPLGLEKLKQRLPVPNETGEALDVPGYAQTASYTCGYIAGLMVVHTFHPSYPSNEFRARLPLTKDRGLEMPPLVRALRGTGIGVSIRTGMRFDDLCKSISRGFPVILVIRTGIRNLHHWVVAYGYQRKPRAIFIAGNGVLFWKNNEVAWSSFRRWWVHYADFDSLVCWGKRVKLNK